MDLSLTPDNASWTLTRSSSRLPHYPASAVPGQSPHSEHNLTLDWCCNKSCVPSQAWTDSSNHPWSATSFLNKSIQLTWPEIYGENKLVVMFGGLHIKRAALKTLGDWLQGCGWVNALVQAQSTTSGTADSFLWATLPKLGEVIKSLQ